MSRWQARFSLVFLTIGILTLLSAIYVTPSESVLWVAGGAQTSLLSILAAVVVVVGCVFAGLAAIVGIATLFIWLWSEASK